MRFLYVGNFSQVRSTEEYVAGALEQLGHDVTRVQEGDWSADRLLLKCEEFVRRHGTGHWFLSSKCQLAGMPYRSQTDDPTLLASFLRRVQGTGMRTCLWVYDLLRREFSPGRHEWAAACAEACDRFVTTDSELGFGHCIRQFYPGAVAADLPDSYSEKRAEYVCDVAFLGELYGPRRRWYSDLRRELGNRFRWFRDGVHGDDLFDLCASAKVVIGPPYPYHPGYWSNRIYLTTGYGGLFAAPIVPGMADEGWMPGVNFYALSLDTSQAVEELRGLLHGPAEYRDRIRAAGQRHCQEHFTTVHRCAELVRLLGGTT